MSPTPTNPADLLRATLIKALDNAHHTHPCAATGSVYWTGCYHPDGTGPSCHSERRADAVLAVLPAPALAVARQLLGTTTGQPATAPWPPTGEQRPDHKLYTLLRRVGLTPEAAQQEIDTYTQTILARQGAPAVDQTPLRDRIRRAVCEAEGFAWDTDMLEPDEYGEVADAVLAVLPAPAVDVADLRDRITTAISKWHRDPEQSLYSQGADAVLAVLAAEAQQPTPAEAEAHQPEHTWAAELHDPLANEWVPGTRYLVRDRAVNALEHARKIAATWKDGTPTERRLVRATTTYTVEPTLDEAEERRRCAHTDVLYGRCVRYLDDHDGDCWHEHYPAASAPVEETK
ncbi:hypothetical protein ACWDRZ_24190 [Streptomyces sp. NPDC003509]